jgi:hypothetical protein
MARFVYRLVSAGRRIHGSGGVKYGFSLIVPLEFVDVVYSLIYSGGRGRSRLRHGCLGQLCRPNVFLFFPNLNEGDSREHRHTNHSSQQKKVVHTDLTSGIIW